MNSADVIGWIVNGEYYCPDCTPTNEEDTSKDLCEGGSAPIFADAETDSFSHCCQCEELIPERLTSDGQNWVQDQFEDFLVNRSGRPEIVRMWAEATSTYWRTETDGYLEERRDLVMKATEEKALTAAHMHMRRKG